MDWNLELIRLEMKRDKMHVYLILKLEEHDYHGVADASMDLRELETRIKTINDFLGDKK